MSNFVVGRRFTQKCRWKFSSPEMQIKASTAERRRRGGGFLRNKDKPSEFFFKKINQHLTIFAMCQIWHVYTFQALECQTIGLLFSEMPPFFIKNV